MKIFKFLKPYAGYVVLIVGFLFIQAFAELAIPRVTADIVDIGIQQNGVDSFVPEKLRVSTFDSISDSLSDDDRATLASSYDVYGASLMELNDFGRNHIDELSSILLKPLAAMSDVGTASLDGEDAISSQAAVSAVIGEYRAMGIDLSQIQLHYLLSSGLKMMAMTCLMVACAVAVGYLASVLSSRVGRDLRRKLFSHVMHLSEAEINSFGIASLITRSTNDIQQIQSAIAMGLRMVVYSPLLAIGGIVMVAGTCVSMVWTIVLAVAAIAIILVVLVRATMPKFRKMQTLIDRLNRVSREALVGIPVIRAFCRQHEQRSRFDSASTDLMRTQLFTGRAMASMMPAMSLVMNMVSVLIVWVGASYVDSAVIQVGDLIAFITYSMVVIMSFLMIGMVAVMLPRADVAAGRVNEVLEMRSSVSDSGRMSLPFCGRGASLEFDKVTFSYGRSGEPALFQVSFTAPAGCTTAIVGSTGAGKTTVLKLIERFMDVSDGTIRIDGIDIADIPLADLRSVLSYVPQRSFLFEQSVSGNIAFGDASLSDRDIERAARIAQADSFVRDLSEGYGTLLTEGGGSVSGGQRQRLAIARALARDARIYLFDDSFSALDSKTDARLRAALKKELAGKTVIIVAQRISTIMDADRIVVLDEGGVVGCGSHDELMDACSVYRQIALSQLSFDELGTSAADVRCEAESLHKGGVSIAQ